MAYENLRQFKHKKIYCTWYFSIFILLNSKVINAKCLETYPKNQIYINTCAFCWLFYMYKYLLTINLMKTAYSFNSIINKMYKLILPLKQVYKPTIFAALFWNSKKSMNVRFHHKLNGLRTIAFAYAFIRFTAKH